MEHTEREENRRSGKRGKVSPISLPVNHDAYIMAIDGEVLDQFKVFWFCGTIAKYNYTVN